MIYTPKKLLLLAGPCAIENESMCCTVAETLASLRDNDPRLNIVFKASFDKANRTSLKSERGVGLDRGLAILQKVKDEFGLPVVTDVHWPEHVKHVVEVVDVIQIPAFLCRQTDLLVAAAQTGKTVFVKKGQFLSPQEMVFIVKKLEESGAHEIWQGDRGTTFGYQNLVVDMRSFPIMKRNGYPTIFDATHSVQLPGSDCGKSGGQREFVAPLARSALAAGADGLFMETHPIPEEAICDGSNQIALSDFPRLIESCVKYWEVGQEILLTRTH